MIVGVMPVIYEKNDNFRASSCGYYLLPLFISKCPFLLAISDQTFVYIPGRLAEGVYSFFDSWFSDQIRHHIKWAGSFQTGHNASKIVNSKAFPETKGVFNHFF